MRVAVRITLACIVFTTLSLFFLRPFQLFHGSLEYHPIDDLIRNASIRHETLLLKQTHSISGAASAYRAKRSRHPPPRFNDWVDYALSKDAVIIEELFDRIYDDLRPFWAVDPATLQSFSHDYQYRIIIRNGTASLPEGLDHAWMNLWFDMIKPIAEFLPDVDLAFNHMDESRLLVPWDDIVEKVSIANGGLRDALNVGMGNVVSTFPNLAPISPAAHPADAIELKIARRSPNPFTTEPMMWKYVREACPPESPGREASVDTDFTGPSELPNEWPAHSYEGYVANWTLAKDVCTHAHLRNLHGAFIEPVSLSVSTQLLPLFGGSKLAQNNEILLPAPAYWSQSPFYSGGDHHVEWPNKTARVMWRGAASGGRNHKRNWRHFHRHRFVASANGSQVAFELSKRSQFRWILTWGRRNVSASNFPIPNHKLYKLRAYSWPGIGSWLSRFSDVAFAHLECFPRTGDTACDYTAPFYNVTPHLPMAEQYSFKYLPDVDGNSYSGRYPAFLRSNSLPIKATIYDEWHDSRLIPWKHFVPMDSTYIDFLPIMDYFLGVDRRGGRDEVAERLATDGKEWAQKVLRREDMLVYVYRLVLEYARLTHEHRDRMGWVGDLS